MADELENTIYHHMCVNTLRKSITLVCKLFEVGSSQHSNAHIHPFASEEYDTCSTHAHVHNSRWLQPVCLACALQTMARSARQSPPLHVFHPRSIGANTSLCKILPSLTNLKHFIGTIELSFATFQFLAQSAGPNLLSLHHLKIGERGSLVSESPAVWTAFKKLRMLDIGHVPNFETGPQFHPYRQPRTPPLAERVLMHPESARFILSHAVRSAKFAIP